MPRTSSPISPPRWNGRSTAITVILFLSDRVTAKQDNIVIGPGSSVAGGYLIIWFFIHFENTCQGHVACLLKIRSAHSRRRLITKSHSLLMLSFVVFGCATLSDSPETPTATNPETQITGAQSDNVSLNTGTKFDIAGVRDRKQSSSGTLSAEEVRQVQTLLKTVGFDPGRIDGAFGPKTKIALLRLRSGCSGLNDLLQGVDLEKIAPAIESSAATRNNAARTMLRKEDIRVIQVRLKDAGFDPGTVDGISGPDTRSAVARFRSGCSALKAMPPAVFEVAGSVDRGDISGDTMARDDIMTVPNPGGGAGSSESGSFTSAATKDSSAGGTRRLH